MEKRKMKHFIRHYNSTVSNSLIGRSPWKINGADATNQSGCKKLKTAKKKTSHFQINQEKQTIKNTHIYRIVQTPRFTPSRGQHIVGSLRKAPRASSANLCSWYIPYSAIQYSLMQCAVRVYVKRNSRHCPLIVGTLNPAGNVIAIVTILGCPT